MAKTALRKEKWTLTFDPDLKELIVREAEKRGIYPVQLLETIVREKYNPFGYTDIADSVSYIRTLRKKSRSQSDDAFLDEIRKWQKQNS